MNFIIRLLLVVVILMILKFTAVFAFKLGDKVNRKRIKKLKELNKRLVEQVKRYENDYQSIYENMVRVNTMMRELKKRKRRIEKTTWQEW